MMTALCIHYIYCRVTCIKLFLPNSNTLYSRYNETESDIKICMHFKRIKKHYSLELEDDWRVYLSENICRSFAIKTNRLFIRTAWIMCSLLFRFFLWSCNLFHTVTILQNKYVNILYLLIETCQIKFKIQLSVDR